MLYRDVVQFDPIQEIIQIREADSEESARRYVQSYVISDHMATNLIHVVIPQLQFTSPSNQKGVLVVGNYGTGKSHLLAVLSAVAEYPSLWQEIRHAGVKQAIESIAGKFKVWRVEIGSVTQSLRDILIGEMEKALRKWGVDYTFPPADKITNHKDAIIAAVDALQKRYPGMGFMLVVDELLDYLRSRQEKDLILDLGFIRELGEVTALTPFRFIAGLQETLFESPRFHFASAQLLKVKDRFEQVLISREDIAYVVAERLLKKNDHQKALVREHLLKFTRFYPELADRLDKFISLFPIHPAYVEVFEEIQFIEKREALKTLSRAMQALLDQPIPTDQPGILSYDHYWDVIRETPSLHSIPEVAEVVTKSNILEQKIKNGFNSKRKHLLPIALRIIKALSVDRLTSDDIYKPIGLKAEELRDTLFLHLPLPDPSAEMLLDQITVTLREIMRTVSGQYITFNEANGQYYLDVKKDIDFDAKIRERGEFLQESDLNLFFFDVLRQVLELSTTTYVTGARIWFYQLPWLEHNVTRPGYLFFGAPDERSTAQPPRDFYVYILPPFETRPIQTEPRDDEVIFRLQTDADFKEYIRLYAGATVMANESAAHREVYRTKADEILRLQVLPWLRQNALSQLNVIYQGVEKPVRATLPQQPSTQSPNLADLIRLTAANFLAPAFTERYPDYPRFEGANQPITEESRPTAAMEAIRGIVGKQKTHLARAVLRGLQLLDREDNLRVYQSPYARYLLDLLHAKPEGQVVNRGEVLEKVAQQVDRYIYKDIHYHLEPEWIAVLLVALVYNGDIVLKLDGNRELDAGNVETAQTLALETLCNFTYYARPRTLPLGVWERIFEMLEIQVGLIRNENNHEQAVRELQKRVQAELDALAKLENNLKSNLRLWNSPIFTDKYTLEVESGVVVGSDLPTVSISSTEYLPHLRVYRKFLQDLEKFDTVGKLRNLKMTLVDIETAHESRRWIQRAQDLWVAVQDLQPLTGYLAQAEAYLPEDHPWRKQAEETKQKTLDTLRQLARGEGEWNAVLTLKKTLENLKREYIKAYADLHTRLVLGPADDKRRSQLYQDPRYRALKELTRITLLAENGDLLKEWERSISGIPACTDFHEGLLEDSPICPTCRFNPQKHPVQVSASVRLQNLTERLATLLDQWQCALRDALQSPHVQNSLNAMTAAERQPLEAFLQTTGETLTLPAGFVDAANKALRGVKAVRLSTADLLTALESGGLPCTVDEFKARFNRFLERALHGQDENTTRITLDTTR
jgi:hypothetical protein